MRLLLRVLLVIIVLVLIVVFPIGGGFGAGTPCALLSTYDTVLFAHRAGAVVFPENSFEGVRRAHRLGYDGVELDIHETADGRFVLIHDDSCQRMLGLNERVDQLRLDQLRSAHLRLNGAATDCRIATLDTVLSVFGDSLLFYLDTKITGLGQSDRLAQLIEAHHALDRTVVATSSIPFLLWLEFRHPEVNTVLEGFDKGEEWTYGIFPRKFRPDLLSSFAFETDSAHAAWLRAHDLLREKIVYGLDSAALARARALGISRFIVDEGVPRVGGPH